MLRKKHNDVIIFKIFERVFTLTIYGSLIWDTSKDDLKLSAKYVMVKDGGKDSNQYQKMLSCARWFMIENDLNPR